VITKSADALTGICTFFCLRNVRFAWEAIHGGYVFTFTYPVP